MSSADISRISSARIGRRLLASDELRLHRHLGRSERHRLDRDITRHALELEHHAAWLDHRHPHLRRTLTLTHAGLGRLLRDGLIGEDPDPHLAAALDVTRKRHTSGFDLPGGDPARLQRLQAIGAERDLRATMGETGRATLEPLAEFDALWTQHCLIASLHAGG